MKRSILLQIESKQVECFRQNCQVINDSIIQIGLSMKQSAQKVENAAEEFKKLSISVKKQNVNR